MTPIRRLDHVALLVSSTEEALDFYVGKLGLRVHSSEEIGPPAARLTYVDVGNAFIQLLEPLEQGSPLANSLDEQGEGLHHICFAVDDVATAANEIGDAGAPLVLGHGRGRTSGFLTTAGSRGALIECTEFDRVTDVDTRPGWLA